MAIQFGIAGFNSTEGLYVFRICYPLLPSDDTNIPLPFMES